MKQNYTGYHTDKINTINRMNREHAQHKTRKLTALSELSGLITLDQATQEDPSPIIIETKDLPTGEGIAGAIRRMELERPIYDSTSKITIDDIESFLK